MKQREIEIFDDYSVLDSVFAGIDRILLVCGRSFSSLKIAGYVDSLVDRGVIVTKFSDFSPNPDYSSVKKAVKAFKESGSQMIVAVGGGSAIDVAKCVKLYAYMDETKEYIEQTIVPNSIPFVAVPTTAGTGSEATKYAVIYYNGNKESITDDSCIPSVAVLDPSTLKTLPEYQKKATMLDALAHAIESFWSIYSTDESKDYSRRANALMLSAANIAGKAINITRTTAGHAMCYKLTGLYGIAHGHAAGLCVSALLPYMIAHTGDAVDKRGKEYLDNMFLELAHVLRCNSTDELCKKVEGIIERLDFEPIKFREEDFDILKNSVNSTRLKNHPIRLDVDTIEKIYRTILK